MLSCPSVPKSSFNGLRVLSLESRRAAEIATLIRNFGGEPTVAPALQEVPLTSNTTALEFGAALVRGEFDAVIFLTGVGAKALLSVIETAQPRDAFLAALARAKVIVRGPKPMAVMREWQVPVWLAAPEPNTWHELLESLDARSAELHPGARVAIQEYGVANLELLEGLRDRGMAVTRVPVYQWALPEDIEPLKAAARAVAGGEIDVVLFTTQIQLVHLFEVAATMGLERDVHRGLTRAVIASIGPTTSEEVRRRELAVDLEASHPKMGVLVTEAAERGAELLAAKRSPGTRHPV
jgi:uroporphyrinogen-III synthase